MDIKLDVGQLQETITVTGDAPLIDTSNASTGAVIDSQQLETLPSGGRSAFLFAVTVPTVVASGDRAVQPPAGSDQRVAAVARRRRAPRQQLPGGRRADHRHAQPRHRRIPTIEAIEGVNVQVHQYDAETGRTGGGTFNVATKSGGNNWHGSGFYQTRPRWGTANNFFSALAERAAARDVFPLGRRRLRRPDR